MTKNMLLKSFEINEFDEIVRQQSFNVRQELANIKDSFQYSLEKPEYLTAEIREAHYKDCIKAIQELDKLSEYLRNGKI